MQHHFVVQVK
uniref:Uncharacterized protein n=1 Tax=Anguilla anguilla TaxID=7936 RepID=A0A0E9RE38_ANGAN